MAQYRVLVGIDYPPNKRAEAGDVVDDLPGAAIKWLTAEGFIEAVDGKTTKSTKTATFNPEAKDGDGDGLLQDGTPFERPVESEEV